MSSPRSYLGGGESLVKSRRWQSSGHGPFPRCNSHSRNFWGNWFILGADIFVSRCSCTDSLTLCIVRGFQRERLCPEQGLIRASCLPFICFPIKYENRPQSAASIFLVKAMAGIIIQSRGFVSDTHLLPSSALPNFSSCLGSSRAWEPSGWVSVGESSPPRPPGKEGCGLWRGGLHGCRVGGWHPTLMG